MGIGLNNYKFGRKNNWRRWSWNRCIEYTMSKPRENICLYLPSKQNIDMVIAKSKGILPNNMFAIERDRNIVKHLRKNGINTIEGDLQQVLLDWGKTPKINIIHADLCSPLSRSVMNDLVQALMNCKGIDFYTVLALNLVRGRDKSSNCIRKIIELGFTDISSVRSLEWMKLHRGWQFIFLMNLYVKKYVNMEMDYYLEEYKFENSKEKKKVARYLEDLIELWDGLVDSMCPIFNSYKSKNGTVMDSVVFIIGYLKMFLTPSIKSNHFKLSTNKKTKNRICAAKAIRTMRKKGVLQCVN